MVHPEIQRKAQQELDEIVGPTRLPSYEDHDSLPYVQAIVLESMRWLPTAPLGVPHSVNADDHYNGYFIPKGTTVIPVGSSNSTLRFRVMQPLIVCLSYLGFVLERVVRFYFPSNFPKDA